MTTPKLSMPELVVGQAGKELTHNQALAILDQLAQAVVIDKDLSTPPGSPANGALYIVAAAATGAWSGQTGKLAFWLTSVAAWTFITPVDGWSVWVSDEALRYERKSGDWVLFSAAGSVGGVPLTFSGSKVASDQTVAANTAVKITFEVQDFDIGSVYNPATSVCTIPSGGAGVWVFGAALIYVATAADDSLSIRLFKNGSQVANIGYSSAGRVTTPTASGITQVQVAVGDTLEIYSYLTTTSGSRDIFGFTGTTRFFGYRVSD